MSQNKTVCIIGAVLVLVLVGAKVLYDQLGSQVERESLVVQEQQDREDAQQTPQQIVAPDFTVYDKEGNEVHLSDYLGKPVILNFWASWCGPCQMEMPDFQEKYLELGEDVHFLMINMTDGKRETVDTASAFVDKEGYTFPIFYDKQASAAMAYQAYSLPMTFFINAEGYAITQAIGAINGKTLQRGIDMIL